MKLLLTTVAAIALVSLGGCNRGAATNNAAANNTASAPANTAAPADTGGKPAGGDANMAAPAPGDTGGKPAGDATQTNAGDQPPPDQGTGGK
jgi:hypothetical protein